MPAVRGPQAADAVLNGAVLAGGESRRMGRTKALVPVDGVPMARRVADTLAAAGCETVVLVGGDPAELAPLGLDVVADRYPGEGPLGGVISALEAHGTDVFVVACDLPFLGVGVAARIAEVAGEHPDADAVVARTDRVESGCVLWRHQVLTAVSAAFADGERAVHRVLDGLWCVEVEVPADELRNINAPDDLAR